MMQQRAKILCQIAAGESTNWIPKNFHRNPKLNREIRDPFNTPASIFQLCQAIEPQEGEAGQSHFLFTGDLMERSNLLTRCTGGINIFIPIRFDLIGNVSIVFDSALNSDL
jgi:hypothetical protein